MAVHNEGAKLLSHRSMQITIIPDSADVSVVQIRVGDVQLGRGLRLESGEIMGNLEETFSMLDSLQEALDKKRVDLVNQVKAVKGMLSAVKVRREWVKQHSQG